MKIFPELIWTLVAMMGGIARHLNAYLQGDHVFSWPQLAAHAFVSGFSGYMFAQLIIELNQSWALIAAGVGGYMGTQALDLMVSVFKKKIK